MVHVSAYVPPVGGPEFNSDRLRELVDLFREECLLAAMDEAVTDTDFVLYFDPREPAVYRVLDVEREEPDKWWFHASLADLSGNPVGHTRLHETNTHLVLTRGDVEERDLSIEQVASMACGESR